MPKGPSKNIFEMLDLQSYRRHFLMFFVRREMIKEERVSVALLCVLGRQAGTRGSGRDLAHLVGLQQH